MKQMNWNEPSLVFQRRRSTVWRRYLLLATLIACLFQASAALAGFDIFPAKGLIYNPGGGTAPTNRSTSYFFGARCAPGSTQLDCGLWTDDCTRHLYWSIPPNQGMAQAHQQVVSVGSAVVFNDKIYAFAPLVGDPTPGDLPNWYAYTIKSYIIDPNTYATVNGKTFSAFTQDSMQNVPFNVAATVWNGAIYIFGTPAYGHCDPFISWSQDGQNWSTVTYTTHNFAWTCTDLIVHDAITIYSSEVPGLTDRFPNVSDSVVLLVASDNYAVTSQKPSSTYILIFDPASNSFLTMSPLTMPTVVSSNFWVVNAAAYFGTMNGKIDYAQYSPAGYAWKSGGTTSTLHVVAALHTYTGSGTNALAHWYLDPTSGSWKLEEPAVGQDAIYWAGGGCSELPTCSIAIAPYFVSPNQDSSCKSDLCSKAVVFSPGFNVMNMGGAEVAQPAKWSVPSDNWKLETNVYKTIMAGDYATTDPSQCDPNVSAAMRALWQINGIIAGPPPFDGTTFDAGGNMSSIDFSAGKTISSEQNSSYSTDFTFSNSIKMGPPFARTKISMSSSMGMSVAHGSAVACSVTIDDRLGTDTYNGKPFGQMGWVYTTGPNITPNLYGAYAPDNVTQLNYTQTAMVIGDVQKRFSQFYLTDPDQVDNSGDPGIFGLLQGCMDFPASNDVAAWNLQPQWEYGAENVNPDSYEVLVGQTTMGGEKPAAFTSSPLQGGIDQTATFTKSKSVINTEDTEVQTSEGISETLTIPLIPEARGGESLLFKITTEMDMSQGWEMESTAECDIDTALSLRYFANESGNITVYPYLLKAKKRTAPWVPSNYTGPLPWLLTWWSEGTPKTSAKMGSEQAVLSGPVFGRAPLPVQAGGSISGFMPPNGRKAATTERALSLPRDDSYFIRGGKLSYKRADGPAIPIAMSASEFNPSKTVALAINKTEISISPKLGKWTLSGRIWRYKSTPSPNKDGVVLVLDFGAKTWSFAVTNAILGWHTDPLNSVVTVTLNLNDCYVLTSRIAHQSALDWESDLTGVDGEEYVIESIHVVKGFDGKGKVMLSGFLPDTCKEFGDFSVKLNHSQHDVPLTTVDGFLEKLFTQDVIRFKDDFSAMTVDLAEGTWSCAIDCDRFETPHPVAEKDGMLKLELKLGGKSVFNRRISCDFYKMDLIYGAPLRPLR